MAKTNDNRKSHHLYADKSGINVLQLSHADIAKNHPNIEEVENLIFELNYDNQAKEILEGQRRYREQMNSQYTAGYTDAEEKYEAALAEKDTALSEKDATIAKLQAELAKYKEIET